MRILLIDNDVDDQEMFAMAVASISSSAVCNIYSNAKDALTDLVAGNLIVDVIFLDLNMPVMDGQEFLTIIKASKELNDIPIVVFSTTSHPATIQRMIELGAEDFITKPDEYGKLVELLTPFIY